MTGTLSSSAWRWHLVSRRATQRCWEKPSMTSHVQKHVWRARNSLSVVRRGQYMLSRCTTGRTTAGILYQGRGVSPVWKSTGRQLVSWCISGTTSSAIATSDKLDIALRYYQEEEVSKKTRKDLFRSQWWDVRVHRTMIFRQMLLSMRTINWMTPSWRDFSTSWWWCLRRRHLQKAVTCWKSMYQLAPWASQIFDTTSADSTRCWIISMTQVGESPDDWQDKSWSTCLVASSLRISSRWMHSEDWWTKTAIAVQCGNTATTRNKYHSGRRRTMSRDSGHPPLWSYTSIRGNVDSTTCRATWSKWWCPMASRYSSCRWMWSSMLWVVT